MSDWRRHPADTARLTASLLVLALMLLLAALAPDAVRNASGDLVQLVRRLPPLVRELLLGVAQLTATVGPVVIAVWLVRGRRLRLLLTAAGAAALAGLATALLQGWLDRTVPPLASEAGEQDSWFTGAAFPSGTYLAGLTAAIVVLGTAASHQWRRAGWVVIAIAASFRLASAVAVPVNLLVTVAIGAAAASVVLVALGAPTRPIDPTHVGDALARIGLAGGRVEEVPTDARHSRMFTLAGSPALVKLIGRDERSSELLLRIVRRLRVKGLEDERPGWSPVQRARHEALATLLAERGGVAVPSVLGVADTVDGDGLLVLQHLPGRPLAELEPDEIDDALLDRVWMHVAGLHAAGIAHRWCDATHVLVDDAGDVHLLDLRWAQLAATDELLANDVADLLVSLAVLVGAERSVQAALRAVPRARLVQALPLLQPLVLTPGTRARLKGAGELLDDVRHGLASAVGVDDVALAPVARLTLGRLVGWFGTAFMAYVVLSIVADWESIWESLKLADRAYLPWVVALPLVGFPAGAMSMLGAVPRPLPFGRTVTVMFAQSFLNRFTPANAGGMALRARYLQTHGSDLAAAATSVGLTSVASGAMQVVLLATLAVWAGSSDVLDFDLPSVETVAIVVFVVLLAVWAGMATSAGRTLVREKLVPSLASVLGDLRVLARTPSKLGLLFGGALLGKVVTIAAFILSCRAFDVNLPVAQLALLYMTANTVAAAVPTPGGVGAIEAALVAVLTGAGADPAVAVSIVLVFRLASYWLPIVPSYLGLRRLRSQGVV